MSEGKSSRPQLSPETIAGKAARTDRLAAEMRKNLMKRKRQHWEMTAGSRDGDRDKDGSKEHS